MPDTMERSEASSASPAGGPAPWSSRRRWVYAAVAAAVVVALVLAVLTWSRDEGAGTAEPAPGQDDTMADVDPGARLSWAAPELDNPTVVDVTTEDTSIELEDDRDYVIVLPEDGLESDGGLALKGGNDVVLMGGRIIAEERALYLIDQTGTMHVEGLSIGGEGLAEGINLDQRKGAVVQLQNIHVDMVTGEEDGDHADLLQVWAGPEVLRIDGFTGNTGYQGFFLLPHQFGDVDTRDWDFRRVVLTGNEDSAYLMWTEDDADWFTFTDVYVVPAEDKDRDQLLEGPLDDVVIGEPDRSVEMPAGEPGVDYESPGYAGE